LLEEEFENFDDGLAVLTESGESDDIAAFDDTTPRDDYGVAGWMKPNIVNSIEEQRLLRRARVDDSGKVNDVVDRAKNEDWSGAGIEVIIIASIFSSIEETNYVSVVISGFWWSDSETDSDFGAGI